MAKRFIDINQIKDEFILKLERTFNFSYERDLYYIDDNISLNNQYLTLNMVNNPLIELNEEKEDANEKWTHSYKCGPQEHFSRGYVRRLLFYLLVNKTGGHKKK